MVGHYYMEIYKFTRVNKICVVYYLSAIMRQDASLNNFETEPLQVTAGEQ